MWWWHNGKEVKSNLSPCGSKVWVQLLTSSKASFGVSPIRSWAWATPLHKATTKRKIYIYIYISKHNFCFRVHLERSEAQNNIVLRLKFFSIP